MKCKFTLIELLVVVAILGILFSIIITSISGARNKAQWSTCVNNMKQIGIAVTMYTDDRGASTPETFYSGTGDYYNEDNHLETLTSYLELNSLFCLLSDKNENDYAAGGSGGWSAGYTYYYNPTGRPGLESEDVVCGDVRPGWDNMVSKMEHYNVLMVDGSVFKQGEDFVEFSQWLDLHVVNP